jgi:hypothetical protein
MGVERERLKNTIKNATFSFMPETELIKPHEESWHQFVSLLKLVWFVLYLATLFQ